MKRSESVVEDDQPPDGVFAAVRKGNDVQAMTLFDFSVDRAVPDARMQGIGIGTDRNNGNGAKRPSSPADWRWQRMNRLSTLEDLVRLLAPDEDHVPKYAGLIRKYRYAVTPYYLSLIDWSDPGDPIRRQCIPDLKETEFSLAGERDPLEEEKDMPVDGFVHRYPDRGLAVVTNCCMMYCRHCTRKRIWHDGETVRSRKELSAMISYVRSTPKIREVVVSGGDPLTMNPEVLDWFLGELRLVPHLEVLRIGTRVPVVLPMMITDELVSMLARHRPLWLNTQFNHPREVTLDAAAACDRILRAGIPVSNQTVLLKGVNDSAAVMTELCHSLQRIMVRPYYLFHCDPVDGVEHFRTSVWTGLDIVEKMRGHTGGLAVPTFVVDAPGGGGKVPLQPAYLLSASENHVVLRNYEGMIIRYLNPGDAEVHGTDAGRSVRPSDGEKSALAASEIIVPAVTERIKRRRRKAGMKAGSAVK